MRSFAAKPGKPLQVAGATRSDPVKTARAFLSARGNTLGAAVNDLAEAGSASPAKGLTVVRYQQRHGGLPVIAGQVTVTVNATGGVLSAQAATTPAGGAAVTAAAVTGAGAAEKARQEFRRHHPKLANVTVSTPVLSWYDPALLHAPARAGHPGGSAVWQLDVQSKSGDSARRRVLVDATDGSIALSYDDLASLRTQVVCDSKNAPVADYHCTGDFARKPGSPVSAVADVNKAWDSTFATYDMYKKLGTDLADMIGVSVDGSPRYLRSTVRSCAMECPMDNAFWDGTQMTYGDGYAGADDVVGHELSHGVTEHTSGLVYYQEAGAINESMSDVFGELIDLSDGIGTDTPAVRWQLGEDLPSGAIRDMMDPTKFGQPDRMTSKNWTSGEEDEGGVHQNSGVGNKAAQLITDGGTFNGQTMTGLGVDKTAKIYWEVQHELTSGASYADLFRVLQQSCNNLADTEAGVTAADCATVTRAVTATEMDKAPTTAPAEPKPAGVCPAGTVRGDYDGDDFEQYGDLPLSAGWTLQGEWAATKNGAPKGGNVLHGSPGPDVAAVLTRRNPIGLAAGIPAYLRFDQLLGLIDGAGARVEASTDGKAWTSVNFVDNGYNGTASDGKTKMFTGESHRWFSSRADLTPYAGKSVYLRLIMSTVDLITPGWWLDNLAVYGCGDGTPSPPGGVYVGSESTDSTAQLYWLPPVYLGAKTTSYEITVSPGGRTVVVPPAHRPGPFDSAYFVGYIDKLKGGTDYTFTVRGRVGTGAWGKPSAAITALGTKVTLDKPGKPANGKITLKGKVTFAATGKPAGAGETILITIRKNSTDPGTAEYPTVAKDGTFTQVVPYKAKYLYQAVHAGGSLPVNQMGSVSPVVTVP